MTQNDQSVPRIPATRVSRHVIVDMVNSSATLENVKGEDPCIVRIDNLIPAAWCTHERWACSMGAHQQQDSLEHSAQGRLQKIYLRSLSS